MYLFGGVCPVSTRVWKLCPAIYVSQGAFGIFWLAFAVHLYKQFSKPYTVESQDTGPMSR